MFFTESFGCYLGWILFVSTLIIICIWRKVFTRTDKDAALRKKLRRMMSCWAGHGR